MADRDTDGTHEISIHALHEESDLPVDVKASKSRYFNPRSP